MSTTTFAELGVPEPMVAALGARGVEAPFPIQTAAIPDALAGRDVLGRAPTGSGKTLAFAVPLLATVGRGRPHRPRGLVLAPTRELAEQIRREMGTLAPSVGRRVTAVYGGVSYRPQRDRLRRGVDVVIATPGRLTDLLGQGDLTLADVTHVVVDEADRMADMGFLPVVRRLLDATAGGRQTVLFSATLDGDVAELIRRYQRDPVRHEVGAETPDAGTARHHFWRVVRSERIAHTAAVVASSSSTIVFTRTRRGADRLAERLGRRGVRAAAIHGGRSQRQRQRALKDFAGGRVEALVATDVAARGIHVDGVEAVVHFDLPEDEKAYLHRSGRTGRAGASGAVVSLVLDGDERAARRLQHRLGLSGRLGSPEPSALASGGELLGERPRPEARDGQGSRPRSGNGRPRSGNGRRGRAPARRRRR